jgi:acetyl esterase/lipase
VPLQILGDAIYPDWFQSWLRDYALHHNAVVVAPNHRLLPESTGLDVLSDINDFWSWLQTDLQPYLDKSAPGTKVDMTKVLAAGESAGGYLAVQSALSNPGGLIKAAIASFPVLDIKAPWFAEPYEKVMLGAPMVPKEVLAGHLETMQQGKIVTAVTPPERIQLALSMVQQGLFPKLLGEDAVLYPMDRLDEVADVPFILVTHGESDSAVPVEGSRAFVEKAEKKFGAGKVVLTVQPGEHGFDDKETLDTPWLQKELVRVTKEWLG